MEAQPLVYVGHMVAGGTQAYAQAKGDLLLGEAKRKQSQDLQLTIGQRKSAAVIHCP